MRGWKRIWKKTLSLALAFALAAAFPALAGQWRQDMNGWRYENDDGTYLKNGWHWLDGNRDGWAECYYFGSKGYMLKENGHVDGCEVNEDGAWTVDGVVQRTQVPVPEGSAGQSATEYYDLEGLSEENKMLLRALTKNRQMDDMDFTYTMSIRLNGADTEYMRYVYAVNVKAQGLSGSNPKLYVKGSEEQNEYKESVVAFYTDGYMYGDVYGRKMKMASDFQDVGFDEGVEIYTEICDVGEGATVFWEDGNTVIVFPLDDRYLGGAAEDLWDILEDVSDVHDDKISDAEGKIVINAEGYLVSAECRLKASLYDEQSETFTVMTAECSLVYNAPGQPVALELPSTEGYEDIGD